MFVGRYMCPKCGTEVYTEVCHNCKAKTDVDVTKLLIEGKRVFYRDHKSEIIPYLIATLTVIILLSIFTYSQFIESEKLYEHGSYELIVICAILCVIIFLIGITPLIKYILLMKFGYEEEATVLGYEGDTVPRNGKFRRYIELLTNVDGRIIDISHFIESSVEEPYPINSKIKIKIRKRHIEIIDNHNSQLKYMKRKSIMNKNIKKFPCKNCGAPVTTDICPYCKANSGINQNLVDLEYPVLNYEAMEKGNLSIVLIILLVLMLFLLFPLTFIFDKNEIFRFAGLFFAIVELIIFMPIISKILSFIIKYHITEKYGDELIVTVQGYMNDKHNVFNYKTLKLLVDTPEAKGYILYRLNTQNKTYKIGSRIKLKVRKNACVIANDKKYYFE